MSTYSSNTGGLVSQGDFFHVAKNFKNPNWKSTGKRAKNLKAILIDEQKRLTTATAEKPLPIDKITYFSIEAPPSLKPAKHWCDITGLEGRYKSPNSGLRYYNAEVYEVINSLGPGVDQQYLSLRGANVVLR